MREDRSIEGAAEKLSLQKSLWDRARAHQSVAAMQAKEDILLEQLLPTLACQRMWLGDLSPYGRLIGARDIHALK